jgi:hypothetical protein
MLTGLFKKIMALSQTRIGKPHTRERGQTTASFLSGQPQVFLVFFLLFTFGGRLLLKATCKLGALKPACFFLYFRLS